MRLPEVTDLLPTAGHQGRRAVGRAVIGDDNLQWLVSLLQDTGEGLPQIALAVEDRHDATDQRRWHDHCPSPCTKIAGATSASRYCRRTEGGSLSRQLPIKGVVGSDT